jgi:hypothetical protein
MTFLFCSKLIFLVFTISWESRCVNITLGIFIFLWLLIKNIFSGTPYKREKNFPRTTFNQVRPDFGWEITRNERRLITVVIKSLFKIFPKILAKYPALDITLLLVYGTHPPHSTRPDDKGLKK